MRSGCVVDLPTFYRARRELLVIQQLTKDVSDSDVTFLDSSRVCTTDRDWDINTSAERSSCHRQPVQSFSSPRPRACFAPRERSVNYRLC